MKVCLAALLLVLASGISVGQHNENSRLVTFHWTGKNQVLATIKVPAGYQEETKSYVEGVQTTLTYSDGAYIILHIGGMIKLPFFTEPTHQVCESQVLDSRVIKKGKVRNTDLFWREENSQGVWPPTNIGFTNVSKDRLKLFEKSLRSFVRRSARHTKKRSLTRRALSRQPSVMTICHSVRNSSPAPAAEPPRKATVPVME